MAIGGLRRVPASRRESKPGVESTRPSSGGQFYGWWLAGIAAMVMIIDTVPLFQGMTAWFVVLENQFGWSRTQLLGAFSLTRVEGSIMGPIGGYLIDRIGPSRMV